MKTTTIDRNRPTLVELTRRASVPAGDSAAAAATHALGMALYARREYDRANEAFRRATSLEPARGEWFFDLAKSLLRQSDWEQAIDAIRSGLALRYDITWSMRLSRLYRRVGNTAAGVETSVEALRREPNRPPAYAVLCSLLLAAGHTAGEVTTRAAGLIRPMQPNQMRYALADALEEVGRYHEACDYWMHALRDAPGDPHILIKAAFNQSVLGDLDGAERLFDQAMIRTMALYPGKYQALIPYFEFLVRRGRLQEVWDHVHRPRAPFGQPGTSLPIHTLFPGRDPDVAPLWDGEQPLDGKTVLLECRGGYGDVFQYGRFAAWLKERGASWVVLEVPPPIVDLCRTLAAADEVVAPYDACRPPDYQCRAKHLPFFVEWTEQWMHAITPYLHVEPTRLRAWSERFDRRLNVGVVWRSNSDLFKNPYAFRSVPLAAFRPLADVPGVRLYGLQVGGGTEELTADTRAWIAGNLEEHTETKDFRDAAAAIEALDVVVSADSGLAHLTGALRKPCFMVCPRYTGWRWETDAADFAGGTSWYPSMHLFVQEHAGDWSGPIRQAADRLRSLAAAHTESTR